MGFIYLYLLYFNSSLLFSLLSFTLFQYISLVFISGISFPVYLFISVNETPLTILRILSLILILVKINMLYILLLSVLMCRLGLTGTRFEDNSELKIKIARCAA